MMCPMMGWWIPSALFVFPLIGIASGVLVIVGSLMLQSSPDKKEVWGTIILVFSVTSVFGLGGFFIGALLGIIGGILALIWKPS